MQPNVSMSGIPYAALNLDTRGDLKKGAITYVKAR
jgi:hypothetical protein